MITPLPIDCPTCGAAAGEPCRNTVGARVGHNHRERADAQEAALQPRARCMHGVLLTAHCAICEDLTRAADERISERGKGQAR